MKLLEYIPKTIAQLFQRNGGQPATTDPRLSGLKGEISWADPKHLFPNGWAQYNPSLLVSRRGLEVFDQMRNDDQVKAALSFKKFSVLASGWEVVSPEGQPEDWEPTEFVQWCLNNLETTLEESLYSILSSLDYGFSVSEKVFRIEESGDWTGYAVLKAVKTRSPHYFYFNTDEFGNLLTLKQQGTTQGQIADDLPIDKFCIYSYQQEFGNWYGKSDLEAAYRAWISKDWSYKWLAMLLERLGIPPIFALYNPNDYLPAQETALKKAIKNLQAATFGALPKPQEKSLEFWAPELAGQATRVFIPALNMFNMDIARAILMPGLLGATPDDKEGSYARSKVHFDVFMLVIEHIKNELAKKVVQPQVIKQLVDLNYGAQGSYPIWKLKAVTQDIRLDILTQWNALLDTGAVVSQEDDEPHIRSMLQFPDKKPGTEIQKQPTVKLPEETLRNGGRKFSYQVRKPNKFEHQVDFSRIELRLNNIQEQVKARIIDELKAMRDGLVVYTSRIHKDLTAKMVEELKLKRGGEIQDLMVEFMRSAYDIGGKELMAELPRKFAKEEPTFYPKDAMNYIKQRGLTLSKQITSEIHDDARQVLYNALKTGETQRETMQKLEDLFEPWVGDETVIRDEDVIQPYRLENMVRTEATSAFNQGRLVAARDPDIVDFMVGMQYSAVLDSRTTEVCRYMDGKVIAMNDANMDLLTPPLHYQCFIDGKVKIFTAQGWRSIKDLELGDLVLTKMGRFRPVTFLHHRQTPISYSGQVIKVTFERLNRSGRKSIKPFKLSLTPDHPVMTANGWVKAGDLKLGDSIITMARKCVQCGWTFPWIYVPMSGEGSSCCSKSCQVAYAHAHGNKTERYRKVVATRRKAVDRVVANHNHSYEFTSIKVLDVNSYIPKNGLRLYNIAVDEDESYFVYGVLSSNCRSILVPITPDIQVPEEDFITDAQVGRAKELMPEGFK